MAIAAFAYCYIAPDPQPTWAQIESLPDTLEACRYCDGLRCQGECQ